MDFLSLLGCEMFNMPVQKETHVTDLTKSVSVCTRKLHFSQLEERLYFVKYKENDRCSFLCLIATVGKKVVRPILKTIQHKDDKNILDGFLPAGCFIAEMDVLERCSYMSYKNAPFLQVVLEEEDGQRTTFIGRKDVTHSKSNRNKLYVSGIQLIDMAEFFAMLYILRIVQQALREDVVSDFLRTRLHLPKLEEMLPYWVSSASKGDMSFAYVSDMNKWTDEIPKPLYQEIGKRFRVVNYPGSLKDLQKQYENEHGALPLPLNKEIAFSIFVSDFFSMFNQIGLPVRFFKHYYNGHYWMLPQWNDGELSRLFDLLTDLFFCLVEMRAPELAMQKEMDALAADYARSFEEKKNIPQKTRDAMKNSLLNQYFNTVEYDEMVDLEKISQIEKEMVGWKKTYLPDFALSKQCAIRFRRLYNHKASGLYYPGMKCLCVDIRNADSFIHEYGHLIDYTCGKLSLQAEFVSIRCMYEEHLRKMADNPEYIAVLNGNTKYNKEYYSMPTEIFARSFELYFAKVLGLKSSLLPTQEGLSHMAYPSSSDFLNAIEAYFNTLLGSFTEEKIA